MSPSSVCDHSQMVCGSRCGNRCERDAVNEISRPRPLKSASAEAAALCFGGRRGRASGAAAWHVRLDGSGVDQLLITAIGGRQVERVTASAGLIP